MPRERVIFGAVTAYSFTYFRKQFNFKNPSRKVSSAERFPRVEACTNGAPLVDFALDLRLFARVPVGVVRHLSLWVYSFTPGMIMTIRLVYDVGVVLSVGLLSSARRSSGDFLGRIRGEQEPVYVASFSCFLPCVKPSGLHCRSLGRGRPVS